MRKLLDKLFSKRQPLTEVSSLEALVATREKVSKPTVKNEQFKVRRVSDMVPINSPWKRREGKQIVKVTKVWFSLQDDPTQEPGWNIAAIPVRGGRPLRMTYDKFLATFERADV